MRNVTSDAEYAFQVSVGQRIREARGRLHLSGVELSKLLETTGSKISRYETGKSAVPVYLVPKIARVLNTTPNYLLGIPQDKNPTLEDALILLSAYVDADEKKKQMIRLVLSMGDGE